MMSLNKLAILCLSLLLAGAAKAQVSAGISINNGDLSSFYLAVGQTYSVPEREVIIVHERQIPDDEIPVVFFIANRAHVRPESVVELRLAGESWMDITLHYHLHPSIFYLEFNGDPGPEYGRVYGYWRHPRNEWGDLRFEDDDIVRMVNLRFVSHHYGVKPEEVIRMRGEQGNFVKVTHVFDSPDYRSNHATTVKQEPARSDYRERGNGVVKGDGNVKGNAKGNDKGNAKGNDNGKDKGNGKGRGKKDKGH